MHNLDLLLTFTGALASGLILGYLAKRLGLSAGYDRTMTSSILKR